MSIQPIFVYSLPRSGSTLFQRMLAAHSQVATASEPWILLPLLSTYINLKVQAGYPHRLAMEAIEDFVNTMPGGRDSYEEELRRFVLALYERATPPTKLYFVDKTPRYSPVAEHVVRLFPEAKHIILWRNPAAVLSSLASTFKGNIWNLHAFHAELYDGLEALMRVQQASGDRIYVLRYEDLISNPETTMSGVFSYLGISVEPEVVQTFSGTGLKGRFGDPTGVHDYKSVSSEPLTKWTGNIYNPLRRLYVRKYLEWIGQNRLCDMGYSLDSILTELDKTPVSLKGMIPDALGNVYGLVISGLYRWAGYDFVEGLRRRMASPEK